MTMAEGEYFPGALHPDIEAQITRIDGTLWVEEQVNDPDSELAKRLTENIEKGHSARDTGKPIKGWEELK